LPGIPKLEACPSIAVEADVGNLSLKLSDYCLVVPGGISPQVASHLDDEIGNGHGFLQQRFGRSRAEHNGRDAMVNESLPMRRAWMTVGDLDPNAATQRAPRTRSQPPG
jgi:hypothetical protein